MGAKELTLLDVQEPASFGKEREDAEAVGAKFRWPVFTQEITEEAVEMTAFEDFVAEKVLEGRSIMGLYPPTAEQTRADFAVWRKEKGR